MNSANISITIAEDHVLFAESLAVLLRQQPVFRIIDIVRNGDDLLKSIKSNKPDLVLLDINMPGKNGIETAFDIRKNDKNLKILIITSYATTKIVKELFKIGINGILYKDADPKELLIAIESIVIAGSIYTQKSIFEKLALRYFDEGPSRKYNLSKREMEIIQLIKEGHTTIEIAESLFLSDYTVDTHKKNIYRKLGVKSSAALIQFILENTL